MNVRKPDGSTIAKMIQTAASECVYGLTLVAETTSPFYWVLIGVIGTALLAVILVRHVSRPAIRVAAIIATAAIAVAFCAAYTAVGLLAF